MHSASTTSLGSPLGPLPVTHPTATSPCRTIADTGFQHLLNRDRWTPNTRCTTGSCGPRNTRRRPPHGGSFSRRAAAATLPIIVLGMMGGSMMCCLFEWVSYFIKLRLDFLHQRMLGSLYRKRGLGSLENGFKQKHFTLFWY